MVFSCSSILLFNDMLDISVYVLFKNLHLNCFLIISCGINFVKICIEKKWNINIFLIIFFHQSLVQLG